LESSGEDKRNAWERIASPYGSITVVGGGKS
jgi:hypothetical protein